MSKGSLEKKPSFHGHRPTTPSGHLSQRLLNQCLGDEGCHEQSNTPGLFKHEERNICFTLVVDDLGIKYGNRNDIGHLIGVLEDHCNIEIDWNGAL